MSTFQTFHRKFLTTLTQLLMLSSRQLCCMFFAESCDVVEWEFKTFWGAIFVSRAPLLSHVMKMLCLLWLDTDSDVHRNVMMHVEMRIIRISTFSSFFSLFIIFSSSQSCFHVENCRCRVSAEQRRKKNSHFNFNFETWHRFRFIFSLLLLTFNFLLSSNKTRNDNNPTPTTGGLFIEGDPNAKVFEIAVDYVNRRDEDFKLEAVVKEVSFGNEFDSSLNVCSLIEVSRMMMIFYGSC